jgi:hypothetical protein
MSPYITQGHLILANPDHSGPWVKCLGNILLESATNIVSLMTNLSFSLIAIG